MHSFIYIPLILASVYMHFFMSKFLMLSSSGSSENVNNWALRETGCSEAYGQHS